MVSDANRWLSLAVAVLLPFGCSSGGGGAQPSDAASAGVAGTAPSGIGGTPASGIAGAGGKSAPGGAPGTGGVGAGTAGATAVGGASAGTGGTADVGSGGAGGKTGVGGTAAGTGGAGVGGTGSGGAGAGGGSSDTFFDDLVKPSGGMTVAIDASGAINVAAAANVSGFKVFYARCGSQCDRSTSWSRIVLPYEADTTHAPTIALTANGRPRILYATIANGVQGYHYLECDAACDQVASWHDVRLTTDFPSATILPAPREPFAVSPRGAAAFVVSNNGNELDVWFCGSSCALGASWARVPLAGTYVHPDGVAFGSDESLQVIATHDLGKQASLMWFDCSGGCSSIDNWVYLDGLWVAQGDFQAQVKAALARTAQGGTRILFDSGDIGTTLDQHVFGYLGCDSSCRNPQSWKQPVQVPLSGDAVRSGFGFALDGVGQPVIATLNLLTSSYLRCTGDCTSTSGQWSMGPSVGVSDLNALLPQLPPASCVSASWEMYVGPDLAFDPLGKPVIAFTASTRAYGGECGMGSDSITTDSFLYSY